MNNSSPKRGPMGGPGNQAVSERPKNFKASMGRFMVYCKPYTLPIVIAAILSVAGAVFTLTGPDRLKRITTLVLAPFENMTPGGTIVDIDMGAIAAIALSLAIFYLAGALCSYIQGYVMATVTQRITKSMRGRLSAKIDRLPLKYFDKVSYGDVLSRITNDVDMIGQTLNMSVGQLIGAIALFCGSLLMMFLTNVTMAFTAIGSTILGFGFMMIIIAKSQKHFKAQQRELGNINGHIEEIYSGLNVIRIYNGEAQSQAAFTKINEKLYDSAWKSQFISGIMMPMMGFIGNFGYVAVCVVGAALTLGGHMGFEVIVAFMIYIRLFTQPLSQLAQSITSLQSTAAAAERVFDFMDETELSPEQQGAVADHKSNGEVEFKNVKFGYSPDKPVVTDFSAHAMQGQKIAIVGPTGSGKTTIVNLLMRFYELDSGEILIDGIPISQMTRQCVHEQFCMVLQDTWLFEGTIRENVVYSMKDVSDEDVANACKAVGLHHYIRTLPHGYNTVLDDSTSLSSGQRQLLTIARAIIENAPLLILDEATSSVDTRTEIQIQKAMDALTMGRTSFIIAHRLSTIKSADQILVMRDGRIIERGTHEELLALGSFYAELYNSQFDSSIA